jgi:hypothetical protein
MGTFATTLTLAAALAVPAFAQSTTAPTTPRTQSTPRASTPPVPPAPPAAPGEPAPPVPPPAPPRRVGQPVNVKIDVTITDQKGGGTPTIKKTVSVVTADGQSGRIRSTANYRIIGNTPLNVDADSEILADGKIRVRLGLQYTLPSNVDASQATTTSTAGELRSTDIQENLSLVLESGKPLIAAQSADPIGDRQVTIEVKATILK